MKPDTPRNNEDKHIAQRRETALSSSYGHRRTDAAAKEKMSTSQVSDNSIISPPLLQTYSLLVIRAWVFKRDFSSAALRCVRNDLHPVAKAFQALLLHVPKIALRPAKSLPLWLVFLSVR